MTKLLTPEELAEMVGVPKSTVYQWNYRGVGPARCVIGRHVRYRPEDVEAWLDAQTKAGSDDAA